MNVRVYSVLTTSHFDRLMKKLSPKHPELVDRFEQATAILGVDPYNKSRKYLIKKLVGVSAGEGQFGCAQDGSGSVTMSRNSKWASLLRIAARGYVLNS